VPVVGASGKILAASDNFSVYGNTNDGERFPN
jgi:hypothetical protein